MDSQNRNALPAPEVLSETLLEEFVSGIIKKYGEIDPENPKGMVASLYFPARSIEAMDETILIARAAQTQDGPEYTLQIEEIGEKNDYFMVLKFNMAEGFTTTWGAAAPIQTTHEYDALKEILTDIQRPINGGVARHIGAEAA